MAQANIDKIIACAQKAGLKITAINGSKVTLQCEKGHQVETSVEKILGGRKLNRHIKPVKINCHTCRLLSGIYYDVLTELDLITQRVWSVKFWKNKPQYIFQPELAIKIQVAYNLDAHDHHPDIIIDAKYPTLRDDRNEYLTHLQGEIREKFLIFIDRNPRPNLMQLRPRIAAIQIKDEALNAILLEARACILKYGEGLDIGGQQKWLDDAVATSGP